MKEKDKKNPFQDTLNLPTTDFSIRAQAAEKEPETIRKWQSDKLYEKTFFINDESSSFIMHDGPPYSNGHIHMGTAFNKVLKDMVCKSRRMMGYHAPFTPGWDCHGLPIELKVTTELSEKNQSTNDRKIFKQACRDYANKWIDTQREEFKELGVLANWDEPYKTLDYEYEADIIRAFATFAEKGYIARKGKTVPWCASCQTVLATAEIEYEDRKDPSTYFLFELELETAKAVFPFAYEQNPNLEINLLVWTTTPWTIPLNRAVVLNPSATYVVIKGKNPDQAIIVGKELAEKVCEATDTPYQEIAEFDSVALQHKLANHPLIEGLQVPILLDDTVMLCEGTACLHSAPGCGPEDYLLGIKHNLEIYSPVASDGTYTNEIEPKELEGQKVTDGQWWVLKKLNEKGKLYHKSSLRHSYPHCWRCHEGLIFRATDQWFCNLGEHQLTRRTLEKIEDMQFIPAAGKSRLKSFIGNRTEWCLSRQRIWGVPIIALVCTACEKGAYFDADFIRRVADKVGELGTDYWDDISIQGMLTGGIVSDIACNNCDNTNPTKFKKEQDILDVWFDAGSSHLAVLEKHPELRMPADLYFEGSDQHRGWFQSSLLNSMIVHGQPMTKAIATHGYVVDKDRRKMSKSVGNVVSPLDIIKDYSRDILRLWVASTDFENDIVISEKLLKNVSEVYRKIRNTCRFLLSNLFDFDVKKHAVDIKDMSAINLYILSRLQEVERAVLTHYHEYNFTGVVQELNTFCVNDLSQKYLDISKDRLYCEKADNPARRSAQTVMFHVANTITHLMAPVLSFLAEEVSDHLISDKNESIHLQLFPSTLDVYEQMRNKKEANYFKALEHGLRVFDAQEVSIPLKYKGAWVLLEEIRAVVLRAIEQERKLGHIKHSLEAHVSLYFDDSSEQAKTLNEFLRDVSLREDIERFFKDWFIVSQFNLNTKPDGLKQSDMPWVHVAVEHAQGVKCPRCWQWDKSHEKSHFCIKCTWHEKGKRAELSVDCSCEQMSVHEMLCKRCKNII